MQIIDREILLYLQEMESCLVAFRGVRQIWANVAGGGALSCYHKFDLTQENRHEIVDDLEQEQLSQLVQIASFGKKIGERIADNKKMHTTANSRHV